MHATQRIDDHELPICLGSDVGAGRTFSMPVIGGRAYDVSLINATPMTPERILWLSTFSASRLLNFHQPDLLVLMLIFSVFSIPDLSTKSDIIDALLFRHDRTRSKSHLCTRFAAKTNRYMKCPIDPNSTFSLMHRSRLLIVHGVAINT